MKELVDEARLGVAGIPDEDAIDPEILRARVRIQIGPGWVLGILRRIGRRRADMTEGAGHADAVRPHQILVVVELFVGVKGIRIFLDGIEPLPLCRLAEIGIWEQTQADDAGRLAVERANGNGRAPRADLYTGVLGFVLERVEATVRLRPIEPKSVFVRPRRLLEAWFVDQPVPVEAIAAVRRIPGQGIRLALCFAERAVLGFVIELSVQTDAKADTWIRRQDLEQLEGAEGVVGHVVPEAIIAGVSAIRNARAIPR